MNVKMVFLHLVAVAVVDFLKSVENCKIFKIHIYFLKPKNDYFFLY